MLKTNNIEEEDENNNSYPGGRNKTVRSRSLKPQRSAQRYANNQFFGFLLVGNFLKITFFLSTLGTFPEDKVEQESRGQKSPSCHISSYAYLFRE